MAQVSIVFMMLFKKSRGLHWFGPPDSRKLGFQKKSETFFVHEGSLNQSFDSEKIWSKKSRFCAGRAGFVFFYISERQVDGTEDPRWD